MEQKSTYYKNNVTGKYIRYICTATDTETNKKMVVYQEFDGEKRFFSTPLENFSGSVMIDGKLEPIYVASNPW